MTKIAVLASGSGSILQAMIAKGVPIELVLADKPCTALEIAETAGIPNVMIDRRRFGYRPGIGEDWDREGFTSLVGETLVKRDIDLVAMAGFFTILHVIIFTVFARRILNIHPAILPDFPGEFAVRDTLTAGRKRLAPLFISPPKSWTTRDSLWLR